MRIIPIAIVTVVGGAAAALLLRSILGRILHWRRRKVLRLLSSPELGTNRCLHILRLLLHVLRLLHILRLLRIAATRWLLRVAATRTSVVVIVVAATKHACHQQGVCQA